MYLFIQVVKYLADKFNVTATYESLSDLIGCDFNVSDLDADFRQQFESSWLGGNLGENESMMHRMFNKPVNYAEFRFPNRIHPITRGKSDKRWMWISSIKRTNHHEKKNKKIQNLQLINFKTFFAKHLNQKVHKM